MKVQTDIKGHKCTFCDKVFARKGTQEMNKRTHTGQNPYHCEICDGYFARKQMLNTHIIAYFLNIKIVPTDSHKI